MFASADSEDGTENVFDADCCNGIVAVVVPFWGESSEGGDTVGVDDVEGSEAAMDAGALSASDGADWVSNSGGGTWLQLSAGESSSSLNRETCLGCRVYARDELGALAVALIVLLQQLASLFVER